MGNPAPLNEPARPDWRHRALCRDVDPEIFFPEGDPAAADAARAVCSTCTVRTSCLREGVREPYGVRAGLTEDERDPLARAYGHYLGEVARVDGWLRRVAAGDDGLREALAAVADEGQAVAAVALTIAAGGTADIHVAAVTALGAEGAMSAALDRLCLPRPARMRQAGAALLSAAMDVTIAATSATAPASDGASVSTVPSIAAVA
jgi:WhiB family redox-sensing transcriptional regulator